MDQNLNMTVKQAENGEWRRISSFVRIVIGNRNGTGVTEISGALHVYMISQVCVGTNTSMYSYILKPPLKQQCIVRL